MAAVGFSPSSSSALAAPATFRSSSDLSYFWDHLPESIWGHKQTQGRMQTDWQLLNESIHSTLHGAVRIVCSVSKAILFKMLLQKNSRIEQVQILLQTSDAYLTIYLKSLPQRKSWHPSSPEEKLDPLPKNKPCIGSTSAPLCIPKLTLTIAPLNDGELTIDSDESSLSTESHAKESDSPSPLTLKGSFTEPDPRLRRRISIPSSPRCFSEQTNIHSSPRFDSSMNECHSFSFSSRVAPTKGARFYSESQELFPRALSLGEPSGIDLDSISSEAIRFASFTTYEYLLILQKVLQCIASKIQARDKDLSIALYNVDCLFFMQLIQNLCSFCIKKTKLKENYILHLKIGETIDEESALNKLQELYEQVYQEWGALMKGSSSSPLPPQDWHLSPLATGSSSSPKGAVHSFSFSASAFTLECSPSPRYFCSSPSAALIRFSEEQSADLQNQDFNTAILLASHYLSYKIQSDHPHGMKKSAKDLWKHIDRHLPTSPLYAESSHQKVIQELALLKSSIEKRLFTLSKEAALETLHKIDLCQALRECFPFHSNIPLVSLRINHSWLQIAPTHSESDPPCIAYYQSLIHTLVKHQKHFDRNPSALIDYLLILLQRMKIEEPAAEEEKKVVEKRSSLPSIPQLFGLLSSKQKLEKKERPIEGEEVKKEFIPLPEDEEIMLLLKIISHSFFSLLFFDLKKITSELDGYRFLFPEPQTVCEIFLTASGDFKTIRTAICTIKKGQEKKGECVTKLIVSRQKGHLSFTYQIPCITLNSSCSPEEQKLIYRGLAPK